MSLDPEAGTLPGAIYLRSERSGCISHFLLIDGHPDEDLSSKKAFYGGHLADDNCLDH